MQLTNLQIPNCQCKLCQLDRLETPESIAKRYNLERIYMDTIEPLVEANDKSCIPLLVKHIDQIEKSYQPGRRLCIGIHTSALSLATQYTQLNRHQDAISAYTKLLNCLGHTDLDSFLPESNGADQTPDAIHFIHPSSSIGEFVSHIDQILLITAFHANAIHLDMLARKLVAMAKHYAWTIFGDSSQMFITKHSGNHRCSRIVSLFTDTVSFE
eukprot:gene1539-1796_t